MSNFDELSWIISIFRSQAAHGYIHLLNWTKRSDKHKLSSILCLYKKLNIVEADNCISFLIVSTTMTKMTSNTTTGWFKTDSIGKKCAPLAAFARITFLNMFN